MANASASADASGNAFALAQALAMASPAASSCGIQSQFSDGIGNINLPDGLPTGFGGFGHKRSTK